MAFVLPFAVFGLLSCANAPAQPGPETIRFSGAERQAILGHGPWPPKRAPDPGNRVSGTLEAIAFGERLFYEPRLSGTGSVLCASCHVPYRGFQDGKARAFGLEQVDRNTPTLVNVRFERRFGWDGANDLLWKQSLRPLLEPREMRSSAAHVAGFIRGDGGFSRGYEKVFSRNPSKEGDEDVLVNVGKALAAFQETLVSGRTPFDDFRDALERGDAAAMARYPLAARRGLRIFVGKGRCSACHSGPLFTSGERKSAFSRPGRAPSKFRVPGLRNVARTAPYMHDGSFATLRDVVLLHSSLSDGRVHGDGGTVREPSSLGTDEAAELVAFLESLSSVP